MLMWTFAVALATAQPVLDSDVPDYHPSSSIKGTLTLGPEGGFEGLLGLWAEKLKAYHPDLSGPLSKPTKPAQLPEAMIAGVASWGMIARPWTGREVAEFKEYTGNVPIELIVGADAVVIVVHRDNPVRALKIDDLDGIYSSTLRRASRGIRTWSEVGCGEAWKGKAIHPYALKTGDGSPFARAVFMNRVLDHGQLREDVKELEGADAVVQAVADDPLGVGFIPYHKATSQNVRVAPLLSPDGALKEPGKESILDQTYPLAWQIRLCYRHDTGTPLEPPLRELLLFILSRDGQTVLADAGYVPISGPIARRETKQVNR